MQNQRQWKWDFHHSNAKTARIQRGNAGKERLTLLGYDVEEAVQVISEKDKGTSIILILKV